MQTIITIPSAFVNEFAGKYQPADIEHLMKLNFVIDQYRQGQITTKRASRLVGLEEMDFLTQCQLRGVSRQTYASEQELLDEFAQLAKDFNVPNAQAVTI